MEEEIIKLKPDWTKKEQIDLKNNKDEQVLELRCASLWLELVEGDLKHKHPVFYHRCCTSFSKCRAAKHTLHPKHETLSLAQIIRTRKMEHSGDLARFVIEELSVKPKYLHQLPRLNYVHQSDLNIEDVVKRYQEDNVQ